MSSGVLSVGLRCILCLSLLIVLSGDVESNPGPARGGRKTTGSTGQSRNSEVATESIGTRSRQSTLSDFSLSQPLPQPAGNTRRREASYPDSTPNIGNTGSAIADTDTELMGFLRKMKTDLE